MSRYDLGRYFEENLERTTKLFEDILEIELPDIQLEPISNYFQRRIQSHPEEDQPKVYPLATTQPGIIYYNEQLNENQESILETTGEWIVLGHEVAHETHRTIVGIIPFQKHVSTEEKEGFACYTSIRLLREMGYRGTAPNIHYHFSRTFQNNMSGNYNTSWKEVKAFLTRPRKV